MAKGRKPAITGLARPEGIVDDIIIPAAQSLALGAARKVSRVRTPNVAKRAPKVSRRMSNTSAKLGDVSDRLRSRQQGMYEQKAWSSAEKAYEGTRSSNRAYVRGNTAFGKAEALANPDKTQRQVRAAGKQAKKKAKQTLKKNPTPMRFKKNKPPF